MKSIRLIILISLFSIPSFASFVRVATLGSTGQQVCDAYYNCVYEGGAPYYEDSSNIYTNPAKLHDISNNQVEFASGQGGFVSNLGNGQKYGIGYGRLDKTVAAMNLVAVLDPNPVDLLYATKIAA